MKLSCWSCKFYDMYLESSSGKEPCISCDLDENNAYNKYQERSEEEKNIPRCQQCNSKRLANISGHCSDMFSFNGDEYSHNGYVPYNINIGGGDYVEIVFCLQCGQMQGKFPITKKKVNDSLMGKD